MTMCSTELACCVCIYYTYIHIYKLENRYTLRNIYYTKRIIATYEYR